MGISNAGLGGIVYAGAALFSKKQAGGMPDKALLVATEDKIHAYKAKFKGRNFVAGDEVAVWDRAGLRIRAAVVDGPDDARDRVAHRGREGVARADRRQGRPGLARVHPGALDLVIHPQKGGRYWYYWLVIIGGTIFVIAALATDMFGTGS